MFRGSHEAKIDDKGRLKLPSAFKQLIDGIHVTQFYVTSTDGKSAEIWPLPSGGKWKTGSPQPAPWTTQSANT
jgi:MraZ protein